MKCKNSTGSGTIRLLHELLIRFDITDTILSDNGAHFTAKVFKDFCKDFWIKENANTKYRIIFFKDYRNRKEMCNTSVIDKRIARLLYITEDPKKTINRHHCQIRKRYSEDKKGRKWKNR